MSNKSLKRFIEKIKRGGKQGKGRLMSYEWIPLGFCLDGSMYSMIQGLEGKSRYIVNH